MASKLDRKLGITVRLPPPFYKELKAAAYTHDISMSKLARLILEHALSAKTVPKVLEAAMDARAKAKRAKKG